MATIMLRHTMGPKVLLSFQLGNQSSKAELPLEGIFFALNFLPWDFLLIKKLKIEKTKTN